MPVAPMTRILGLIAHFFEWIDSSGKGRDFIVAHLLDANDYPAGDRELPVDKTALDMIMIVAAE